MSSPVPIRNPETVGNIDFRGLTEVFPWKGAKRDLYSQASITE